MKTKIEILKKALHIENQMRKKITKLPNGKYRNYLESHESERVCKVIERVTGIKDFGNQHRAEIEIFDFVQEKPKQYTCYLNETTITNWTGIELARVQILSKWRDNFGGERISFRTVGKAINGVIYSGIGYAGFGGYARMKAIKQ